MWPQNKGSVLLFKGYQSKKLDVCQVSIIRSIRYYYLCIKYDCCPPNGSSEYDHTTLIDLPANVQSSLTIDLIYQNHRSPLLLNRYMYMSSTQILMSVQQCVIKILTNNILLSTTSIDVNLLLHLWPCDNKIRYHLGSSYTFGEPVHLADACQAESHGDYMQFHVQLLLSTQALLADIFQKLPCKDCCLTDNWIMNQCVNS